MLESVRGDEAARLLLTLGVVARPKSCDARSVCGRRKETEAPPAPESERRACTTRPPVPRGIEFLRELAAGFAEFPYENISKIIKVSNAGSLRDAIRLPTEVVTDHIERNFGGTCFSLTFLFERVLASLGFDCYRVMADMRSGRNVHCLVVVREGGTKYIIDPGYALYEVIALPAGGGERVRCPHATVEVQDGGAGTYDLWTEDASGRKWRYRFEDRPVDDRAFEDHWLASFGKSTLHNICLTRMTPRGHIYLRKDFFKFTSPTSIEKRRVAGGCERLIEEEFGIGAQWADLARSILDAKRAEGKALIG